MATKKYDNGLTVTVEYMPGLRSVSAGIMVGTGSAFETPDNNGISHFIEHMQFKGTETRSAADIVREYDEAGASYNAFTGKEYTCYYFRSIDEKLDDCFGILSDLFLHSVYDAEELDRERKVILEEINMSMDEPDGVCYDTLCRVMYRGSLGMEVLGTKANVSRFSKADILKYKSACYVPSNTVVAFIGNVTPERAYALVEEHMGELISAPYAAPPVLEKQKFCSGFGSYIHDYEQSELAVAFPSYPFGSEQATVVSALDCVLGSGMSSRLFQRIREKMGLCYSVYSAPTQGRNNGSFTVYANVSPVNARKCLEAVADELDLIVKKGVTDAEAQKAKMQLKVNTLFAKEAPQTSMLSYLRWQVLRGEEYDTDELLRRIERVSTDSINAIAREILCARPAVAYAGKAPELRLDDIF